MSHMSPLEFLQYAREPKFDEVTRRLAAYTAHRLARHGHAARGMDEPLDFVHEAVRLVLEGSRHVPAGADDSMKFRVLASTIDSLIIHARERLERKGLHLSLAAPGDLHHGDIGEDRLAAADAFEDETIARQALDRFVESLDPQLGRYVRDRVEHDDLTAEEHARRLDLSVAEIRNLARRLGRRRGDWPTPTTE